MVRNSIVFKLWLSMTGLVLIVFLLIAVMQYQALYTTYFSQQTAQLVALGHQIADAAANGTAGHAATNQSLMMSNVTMDTQVYVVSSTGQSFAPGMWSMMSQPAAPPLAASETARLKAGRTVKTSGWDPYYRQEMLSVDVPIMKNGRYGGAVIIRQPLTPIYSNTMALQKNILAAGLGGLILATLLSLLLSRSLARPLKQMIDVARAMGRGDYSRRVRTGAMDEVGALATTLNTLAAELEHKIEDLERLNQTRRDFVANVSHELRTPLSVIQGFTEALVDGLARDEASRQHYLQNILDEVLRLRRLTTDLLDLRRLEQGGWQLEGKDAVYLTELLAGVRETLSPLAAEKGVTVTLTTPPAPLSPVPGNRDRLQQVFVNLLDNAIKATPPGGRVALTAGAADGGRSVEAAVSDTGPGISPADLPLIWERFYKGDKSRTRSGVSTGLGLAIVRAIVEAHGGCVTAVSPPGQGATFRVVLPAAETSTERKPYPVHRPAPLAPKTT
ncbi:MAG: ATP-binding protein [Peptococcaceae bacterium]|jgi:signal transduction histidine kinase|nr:ATP-binding protein [Peptococcaceae bacterium]